MMSKILVVDDEPDIRDLLKDILDDEGYEIEVAEDGESARKIYQDFTPDLILLDIWMPDVDGISLLKEWEIGTNSHSAVVMMSGHGTVETAMEATKFGAQDFLEKPISMAKLLSTVSSNLSQNNDKKVTETSRQKFEELVGSSERIKSIRKELTQLITLGQPIFISGGCGVGKHVVASHVAYHSEGIKKIIWVSPSNFHLPSYHDKDSVFFIADFMELSLRQLEQLANFLIENEFVNRQKNLRFVLSTVEKYSHIESQLSSIPLFKEGWRLAVKMPLLNEHREDIPELLEYYVNWISSNENLPYRHFNVAAQNLLRNHDWRGNLSELKALIRKLLASKEDPNIELDEISVLLEVIERRSGASNEHASEMSFIIDLDKDLKESRELFERQYLELQLEACGGNMSELARRSGQERTYLYRKIKSLGIPVKK